MANDDCGCIDHTGPHWRHVDKLWRERNRELLTTVQDGSKSIHQRELAYFGFCQEEQLRLSEKLLNLKREAV